MSDKRIIIDLSQTDTKPFDDPIQADAKRSFENLINNFLTDIDKNKDKDKNRIDRVHNTILINGKRGMGKTSFILSIENAKKSASEEKILKDICPLGIIDPTLIETKEHVLLNIITLIKDKVDESIHINNANYSDSKYKNWKESLKKLAGGLSMLDGVGSDHLKDNTLWDSPELILERGLSNAKQGVYLEKNFHEYIGKSLDILKKEAFFLILDDIDTSLDKGSAILETLRKYLTSRKLIIAMLGDIDLYSTLVRQLQWEKMDPKGTLDKYEGKEKYVGQIEHLEEQYLTKVLKPENRIDLQNLLFLKEKLAINNQENSFISFIRNMINTIYFTKNDADSKTYEHTILTQSTRSVIQVLKAWNDNKDNNDEFITMLKHTFFTTIKKKLEKYNLLEPHSNDQLLNLISIYILQEKLGNDTHLNLIPDSVKDDDNIAMLYLNAMANKILNGSDYLSYFIKIGYILEGYKKLKDYELHKYIDDVTINSGELSSIIAEKLLSTATFGIVPSTAKDADKYFGNLFISKSELKKIAKTNIDNLLCVIYYPKQGNLNFLSFFKFIGYIADVSNHSVNLKNTDLEMMSWLEKAQKIKKIPLFVLAKIWKRVVETFIAIEEENTKNKSFKELFELYRAGFLNAVYVEIQLYNNKSDKEFNIKNVLTSSDFFYKKLKKDQRYINSNGTYVLKQEERINYSFFDYLFECPLLKSFDIYFGEFILEEDSNTIVHLMNEIKKNEVDFSKLSSDEQKNIIITINGWQKRAISTMANNLRYDLDTAYKNISEKLLAKLLIEMKN